jgi:hypothetical protein
MTIIIAIFIGAFGEILLEKYCPGYRYFVQNMRSKIWNSFSAPFSNASSNAEQISRIKRPKKLLDRYKILRNENK